MDDAVKGTAAAAASENSDGEIYRIGNIKEINMACLNRSIGKLIGYSGEYEEAISYPGSVGGRCPDITKAREELGFNPIIEWQSAV